MHFRIFCFCFFSVSTIWIIMVLISRCNRFLWIIFHFKTAIFWHKVKMKWMCRCFIYFIGWHNKLWAMCSRSKTNNRIDSFCVYCTFCWKFHNFKFSIRIMCHRQTERAHWYNNVVSHLLQWQVAECGNYHQR